MRRLCGPHIPIGAGGDRNRIIAGRNWGDLSASRDFPKLFHRQILRIDKPQITVGASGNDRGITNRWIGLKDADIYVGCVLSNCAGDGNLADFEKTILFLLNKPQIAVGPGGNPLRKTSFGQRELSNACAARVDVAYLARELVGEP